MKQRFLNGLALTAGMALALPIGSVMAQDLTSATAPPKIVAQLTSASYKVLSTDEMTKVRGNSWVDFEKDNWVRVRFQGGTTYLFVPMGTYWVDTNKQPPVEDEVKSLRLKASPLPAAPPSRPKLRPSQ